MLRVATWAEKDEAPSKWLHQGTTVLVVADTGCARTLVSEAFADRLGLKMNAFLGGRPRKVKLGNSNTVTPVAAVSF